MQAVHVQLQRVFAAELAELLSGHPNLGRNVLKKVCQRAAACLQEVAHLVLHVFENVSQLVCLNPDSLRGERIALQINGAKTGDLAQVVDLFGVIGGAADALHQRSAKTKPRHVTGQAAKGFLHVLSGFEGLIFGLRHPLSELPGVKPQADDKGAESIAHCGFLFLTGLNPCIALISSTVSSCSCSGASGTGSNRKSLNFTFFAPPMVCAIIIAACASNNSRRRLGIPLCAMYRR